MGQEMRDRAEIRKRMAKHITALVFDQFDNDGGWLVHQEYTEGLVDAALEDWRKAAYAAGEESMRERAAKFVEEPRAQALYRSEIAAAIRGLALEE